MTGDTISLDRRLYRTDRAAWERLDAAIEACRPVTEGVPTLVRCPHCTGRGKVPVLAKVWRTSSGIVFHAQLRHGDIDGRININGRVVPAVGSLLSQLSDSVVRDGWCWLLNIAPWPEGLPQPDSQLVRCPQSKRRHLISIADLLDVAPRRTFARPLPGLAHRLG